MQQDFFGQFFFSLSVWFVVVVLLCCCCFFLFSPSTKIITEYHKFIMGEVGGGGEGNTGTEFVSRKT